MDFPNASSNETTRLPLDLYRVIPVSILLALIDFVTIFGNILVIVAVLRTRSIRHITCNYYIVSLAVSDLLLGILVLPLSSVYEIVDYWVFPSFLCVFWLSTDVLSCTASILNLLCISVDRYLAISRPLHYHRFSTPKFIFIMIGMAWVLSIFISVAPVFGFESDRNTDQCRVAASGLFWTLYSSVGSFFLPLLVMLFLYYRIYLVAAKHSRFMKEERERFASFAQQREEMECGRNSSLETSDPIGISKSDQPRVSRITIMSEDTPQREMQMLHKDSAAQVHSKKTGLMKKLRRLSRDKKAAKTLFIVMACFIGCWFPFFTIYLIDGVCKEVCSIPNILFDIFFWLGYCNSMLNPVIYAASSHDFRMAFRKILHCSVSPNAMDQFGQIEQRNIVRSCGNGLSGTSNNLRQNIPSHLINKPEKSPTSNRFRPVCDDYPLVEQQESESPTTIATGHIVHQIEESTLQQAGYLKSSDGTNGSAINIEKDFDETAENRYGIRSDINGTPEVTLDGEVLDDYLHHDPDVISPASGSVSAGRKGWNKVKRRAKQMVAKFSDKKTNPEQNEWTVNSTPPQITQRIVHVSDVGMSTVEHELADIGVQTSISFVELGLI